MANLRTPLFDWHVARKARMVPFGGWEMPVQYTGIIEEHKAVRTSAGLFDISHMARLRFDGPDTLAVLEQVFTNSVTTMKDGQVRYGLLCDETGGILDDVLIYRLPHGFSMIANAGNAAKVIAWMQKHLNGRNAKLIDDTSTTTLIAVQGPNAVGMVASIFGDSVKAMKYYFAGLSQYQGTSCLVSRTGYTGEDGFEIAVDNSKGLALWEQILNLGALPCGLGARDTLRLEAAMPLYGHELNETIDPIQAGLGWAVKPEKGDFIGRAAILAKPADRPVRVGLELEGKRAARQDSPILSGTSSVGTITSGSYVPHLEKSIAMGYVAPSVATIGTKLSVDLRGTQIPATVVPLPFYKRAKG